MKRAIIILGLVIYTFSTIAIVSCKKDSILNPTNELLGSYIGQTPPVNTPLKFAPNSSYLASSSWWWRSAPAFSPNGDEMYFTRFFYGNQSHEIWCTKIANGKWTEPQKVQFSTTNYDSDVQFLESNDTIYFYSRRADDFIFKTTRTPAGWSEPVALSIPKPLNSGLITSYAIVNSKTIYFAMLEGTGYNWASADIYITRYIDGQYTQPENIGSPISIANVGESVAYVDPSERFIVFSSTKSGGYGSYDLYISYKNEDGTWRDPVNLGTKVNSSSEEDKLTITPDGKYVFFTTMKPGDRSYSPYWVDAGFLNQIK
jgi:hypothetical protein